MPMPSACASRGFFTATSEPFSISVPLVGDVEAHHAFDERRLAGAVLAEQRVECPGGNLDRDVVERGEAPESLGHADGFQRGPREGGASGWRAGSVGHGAASPGEKACSAMIADRAAAVRPLMLGAAGDIDFRVSDETRQRAGDECAGVARGGNIPVVEHRVTITAQRSRRARLRLGEHRDDPRSRGALNCPAVARPSSASASRTGSMSMLSRITQMADSQRSAPPGAVPSTTIS